MVLVNDRKLYHGVTPITPIDPAAEAYRDVLVITFRAPERGSDETVMHQSGLAGQGDYAKLNRPKPPVDCR